MVLRYAVLMSFVALFSACGERRSLGEGVSVTDSLGIPVVFSTGPAWDSGQNWRLSETPKLSIGVRTGDEAYLFFNVADAFQLPDGGVAVVHSSRPPSFRLYDQAGKHIRSFGAAGEGPGEFRSLPLGWLEEGETLGGYDPTLGRITRFTMDGQLLDTQMVPRVRSPMGPGDTDLPPRWVDRFGDGRLLGFPSAVPYEEGRSRPVFPFTSLDLSTLRYDTLALALGADWLVKGLEKGFFAEFSTAVFSPMSVAVAHDTTAFVSDTKDFWITEVAPGGRVVRRFGRAWEPKPVTPEEKEKYRAQVLSGAQSDFERRDAESRLRIMVFADTHPAHDTRMIVDSGGNLWVALQPSETTETRMWSVFDPEGVYLGDVSIPKLLRVKEIGIDAVVGVWRDELDVQSVRAYHLRKPDG